MRLFLNLWLFHQVPRDGWWSEEYSSQLVPGDVISINAGDIILADARLLEGDDAVIIDEVSCNVCD